MFMGADFLFLPRAKDELPPYRLPSTLLLFPLPLKVGPLNTARESVGAL